MEKINPRVDIAFKKLFGAKENKDLLISFINAIVSQEDQVVDLELLNLYDQQHFKEDRLSVLYIEAESVRAKKFNLELQVTDEAAYSKRLTYYWSKLYAEVCSSPQGYVEPRKVIGIHILNFTSVTQSQQYHNAFGFIEKKSGRSYFGDLELHTIELKKFTDAVGADEELSVLATKLQDSLDVWSTFLVRYEELSGLKALPPSLNKPELKKAIDVLKGMNFNAEEREAYEAHLKMLAHEALLQKK